jgi:hypothetical protein
LSTVCNILTDFGSYHGWNPMLSEVRAELEEEAAVRFTVAGPDSGQLKLKARITVENECSERSPAQQGGIDQNLKEVLP